MAKTVKASIVTTVDGNDIVIRLVNGLVAEAAPPRVTDGKTAKKGMVVHSGGFQPLVTAPENYISVMQMRRVV